MPKLLLFMFLVSFHSISQNAQKQYDKCYFGTAAVDFGGWFPTVLTNSQMVAVETAVSMCSENGDLLFYSNGGNSPTVPSSIGAVWNANHEVMENGILGDSSGCISSFDGAVAFPAILSNSKSIANPKYYIFMRDCIESSVSPPYFNSGLTYCEIDMDANNGLGKVVSKNNTVVPFQEGYGLNTDNEPVAAILKGTNDGWHVFSYNVDSLYSIDVDNNGIGNYKFHVKGGKAIVFSPSREHVVVGNKLYNYDMVNNELTLNTVLSESKCAFSPNGKVLYGLGGGLKQYDLTASDILASKITITSSLYASRLFLTPDGRIYFFIVNGTSILGYIDCPNTLGVNCGLKMSSIYLGGKQSGDVFTNIPANFLYNENVNCTAALETHEIQNLTFQVYPNPSRGLFMISVNNLEEPQPFQVISLDGKVVFKDIIRNEKQVVDLSTVQAGVYFVDVMGTRKRLVLW